MEFLTLQDVPRYHRSIMTAENRTSGGHGSRQTDARMDIVGLINQTSSPPVVPSLPPISSLAAPLPPPPPPQSPPCDPLDGSSDRHLRNGPGRELTLELRPVRALPDPMEVEYTSANESREPSEITGTRDDFQRLTVGSSLQTGLRRTSSSSRTQMPSERLPGFSTIARIADQKKESSPPTSCAPASHIGFWQTTPNNSSRQSSVERPKFNDPFLDHPSKRKNIQHRPEPISPENYTTRSPSEASQSLTLRQSYDLRSTSVQSEYDPRLPSVPSLFDSPGTRSSGSSPTMNGGLAFTPPPSAYRPPTSISGPPAAPHPHLSHDYRRVSEANFPPPGYSSNYSHLPQRPSYPHEPAHYPRAPLRHESMYPHSDAWPYPPPHYAYGIEGFHPPPETGYVRRRRGNLPKEATQRLKQWFHDHADSPYPSEEEKNMLAVQTGLQPSQIANWFINARRRNPGKEAREQAKLAAQQRQQQQRDTPESQRKSLEDQLKQQQQLPQRFHQQDDSKSPRRDTVFEK